MKLTQGNAATVASRVADLTDLLARRIEAQILELKLPVADLTTIHDKVLFALEEGVEQVLRNLDL